MIPKLAYYVQQEAVGLLADATRGKLHVGHATDSTHLQNKCMYKSRKACYND